MSKSKKIVIYHLTRDFRTFDNKTLYKAYEYAQNNNAKLITIFRFNSQQIDPKLNAYYSSNAVQFMVEALKELSNELNINFVNPISDKEYLDYLKSLNPLKILIARDFTPFAKQRLIDLQKVADVEEVDDITVYPIKEYAPNGKIKVKLKPFIDYLSSLPEELREVEVLDVDWLKTTHWLPDKEFLTQGFSKSFNEFYKVNPSILVHPSELDKLLDNLPANIKGYSEKVIREKVGEPKVSYLSAFIKFGLVSIRYLHELIETNELISSADADAFTRELYFRDFYYAMAYFKPEEVFEKPNWETNNGCPKFINEVEAKEFSFRTGLTCKSTSEAKQIWKKFMNAETEYDLINAGVNQLVTTGYLIGRVRMLLASYCDRDNGLWWKICEKFYANNLTDYDWTINAMNHQNIAKVGLYPKYTLDFSISTQEKKAKSDKKIYIDKYT